MAIDGDDAEWREHMQYFEDEKIAIGVKHDDENVYVCIGTQDRSTAKQLMMRGLTVWFDAEGGSDEKFGIHFPLSQHGSGIKPPMQQRAVPSWDSQSKARKSSSSERPITRLFPNQKQDALEIITCEDGQKDIVRVDFKELKRIKVGTGNTKGAFVYELQVPLQKDKEPLYAVGSDGKSPIGIGIITDEQPERPSGTMGRKSGGKGSRPSGGMGGPPSGGKGGKPGGGKSQGQIDIELWLQADLK